VQTSRAETFLFDLAADAAEQHDLAGSRHDDVARLSRDLAAWTETLGLPPLDAPAGASAPPGHAAPAVDAATQERLKALGYAQ
jgi:hypothetical protein